MAIRNSFWGESAIRKRALRIWENRTLPHPARDGSGDRIGLVAQKTGQVNFVRHLHGDKVLTG